MFASNSDGRPVACDPKSPATFLLPNIKDNGSDGVGDDQRDKVNMLMDYMWSDNGSGCNTFESSAIMNLLDARDTYLDEMKSITNNSVQHHQALLRLSRDYRKALATCIGDWSEDLEKDAEEPDSEGQQQQQQQQQADLGFLRATYAITHLSEIFLLLPISPENRDGTFNTIGYAYENDVINLRGAVTADTVRFLRKHHFSVVEDYFDPSVVDKMYTLWQPDQYDDGNNHTNTYWELVEAYMVRGCLEEAWALLSHHSIVRRIGELEEEQQIGDYQAAMLDLDLEGFRALKSILLSAPLPGSRNSDSDEGFGEYENNEEDFKEEEDKNDRNDDEEELIEGISSSAYYLWERSGGKGNSRTGNYYMHFEPNTAYQVHQNWKQAIHDIPSLQRLRRRLPQLNKLLNLLVGDFRDIEFGSWQEELCAELLYANPTIPLVDIHLRAAALKQKYLNNDNDAGNDMIDEIELAIMRNNYGEFVNALQKFGGNSGAALPAVVTSLLTHLLKDANYSLDVTGYNMATELLLEASSATRTSLATEGYFDLGTRLAVRLLLPHIEIDSDTRITATLVNALDHHSPKSDGEAKSLLALCRNLIERKNIRVLDGCVSICLARYIHYIGKRIPGGAVHWLLTGMHLESLVLCEGPKRSGDWQRALTSGVCYRKLIAYFTETSRTLLKTLLGEESGASLVYDRAKEMVVETKKEDSNLDSLASFVSAVRLLENMITIAGAIVERKDNSIIASGIISCLEERPNDDDDGVVSCLARSLSWDLLRLGIAVLDMDATLVETKDRHETTVSDIASFDVRGMGILLSVFTIETKARALKEEDEAENSCLDENELQRYRLALAEGLKRAFVSENAMKRAARTRRPKMTVYAANLSKCSREEQEWIAESMLNY
mmetsp:Transcript_15178/g.35174  ORF Transcript_15178/g.35174 Transcript_15178/m.35174 type:complete len:892 (+) Transcript_15178:74-2749(+)